MVMPWTPSEVSASRTSSSLNGLMMAVTSFMALPPGKEGPGPFFGPGELFCLGYRRAAQKLSTIFARWISTRLPRGKGSETYLSGGQGADQLRQDAADFRGGHARLDPRLVKQCQQDAVVDRQVADPAGLVERGPGIALVVVRQAESVQ